MENNGSLTRRDFGVLGMAAAATPFASAAAARLEPLTPGMKISMQVGENATDEELAWVKQMGVEYLNVQTGKDRGTLENFLAIKKRAEAAGLKVWNISNNDNRNIEEITLNLPGRDEKIAWLKQYIRDTGKAGIGYITYAHMANGIWSSATEKIRGGAICARVQAGNGEGLLERQDLRGSAFARPQIFKGRTLG